MTPYDLLLPARRLDASDALQMASEAERLGWRGVWASEVLGLDALVLLGSVAATTPRVRVGTAIVPVSTRSAALLAMAAATIAQFAPGRLHLGIGTSTPTIVSQRHDRPVTSPVAEAMGTVEVVRRALRGETVEHPDHPKVSGLRIEAPEVVPPVLLAALGPKMTEAAMAHAQGLVLNMVPPQQARVRAAQSADGQFETLLLMRTCVDPTEDDISTLRKEVAGYARVPVYRAQFERAGLDISGVIGAPDVASAGKEVSDELLEVTSVVGSADACRERLDALVDGRVTPLVIPFGGDVAAQRTLTGLAAR